MTIATGAQQARIRRLQVLLCEAMPAVDDDLAARIGRELRGVTPPQTPAQEDAAVEIATAAVLVELRRKLAAMADQVAADLGQASAVPERRVVRAQRTAARTAKRPSPRGDIGAHLAALRAALDASLVGKRRRPSPELRGQILAAHAHAVRNGFGSEAVNDALGILSSHLYQWRQQVNAGRRSS